MWRTALFSVKLILSPLAMALILPSKSCTTDPQAVHVSFAD